MGKKDNLESKKDGIRLAIEIILAISAIVSITISTCNKINCLEKDIATLKGQIENLESQIQQIKKVTPSQTERSSDIKKLPKHVLNNVTDMIKELDQELPIAVIIYQYY